MQRYDTTFCVLAADARVECKQHGVVVAAVPWARHLVDLSTTSLPVAIACSVVADVGSFLVVPRWLKRTPATAQSTPQRSAPEYRRAGGITFVTGSRLV